MNSDINDALARVEPVIEPDMPSEMVLRRYDRWQAFVAAMKEADKLATAAVSEWVRENGPLDAGNVVYWLAHEKRTKCNNVAAAVEALLMVSQGDVESFCRDFLGSDAVKYGAAKRALDAETYGRLFTTTTVDKLESGEALPKKLQKTDKQFLREGKGT